MEHSLSKVRKPDKATDAIVKRAKELASEHGVHWGQFAFQATQEYLIESRGGAHIKIGPSSFQSQRGFYAESPYIISSDED